MIVENPLGNFSFVRGIGPFSMAAIAQHGFEIVHTAVRPFVPLARGYELVERHLNEAGRPINSLCGMELRVQRPMSRQAFDEFNRPYIEKLKSWGLNVDGANPVARTNIALEVNPVAEAVVAGFFYTIPSDSSTPTFVLAGSPEIKSRNPPEVVAPGETSAEAMRAKTECVLEVLTPRLAEMGVGWDDASVVNVYTVQDLRAVMVGTLLPGIGDAARGGIVWHYGRPPVTGLEIEIDLHRVRRELIIQD